MPPSTESFVLGQLENFYIELSGSIMQRVMETERESRKLTLDHMVDEKFAEIFFLTKDEHNVPAGSRCEKELYDMLNQFKRHIREYCETRRKDPDGYQSEV